MRVKMLVTRRMKREHSEARMKNKRSPGRGKGINPPPLPQPIYEKTNQTTSSNQACTWNKSKLKTEDI
jgi:hypothetical protein